jgi:predicted nucleic acid-binding protein
VILLDTDVLIDLLRAFPPAIDWLASVPAERFSLPGYVVLELLDGCSNQREVERLLAFLSSYRIVWPRDADCHRAIADFGAGRLRGKIGIIDVLIAECAVGLAVPLYTFNTKHYSVVPGLCSLTQSAKRCHSS